MIRHATLVVAMLVLVATGVAACGGDEDGGVAGVDPGAASTSSPSAAVPSLPTDGVLFTWWRTAGECRECGYEARFDADGTLYVETGNGSTTVAYDADELRTLLTGVTEDDIAGEATDCGREVDGNASLFRIADRPEVDGCHRVLDLDHPVLRFVRDATQDARSRIPTTTT